MTMGTTHLKTYLYILSFSSKHLIADDLFLFYNTALIMGDMIIIRCTA